MSKDAEEYSTLGMLSHGGLALFAFIFINGGFAIFLIVVAICGAAKGCSQ
jgi:hypothetical protein